MGKEQELLTSRLHTIVGDDYFPRGEQLSMWAGYGINKREVVAMARELLERRRSSDEQAEVVGDEDEPISAGMQAVIDGTKAKIREAFAGASPSAVKAGVTEEMVELAMAAFIASVREQDAEWTDEFDEEVNLTSPSGDYFSPYFPIRAALVAALGVSDKWMGDGWQPIETAPKDGTEIHVFAQTEEGVQIQQVVFWDAHSATGFPWCLHDGASYQSGLFTHWRPLPTPPIQGDDTNAN